ncbi:MAG: ABC transporter transmembrane domain-containing protein [Cyanobacteria bacterium P01_H01_bin.74]
MTALAKIKTALQRDAKLYIRMLYYLKPYRFRFLASMLSSLPVALMQGGAAWLIGPLTDQLLKEQDFSKLIIIPALLMGATVIEGCCMYINAYCSSYIGQGITLKMREELFAKLSTMEFSYFKKNAMPDLLTRYCSDPGQLQMAINANLQDLLIKLMTIIGLTAVILYRNWQYALISLFIISFIVWPLTIISKKVRHMDHINRELTSELYILFQEFYQGYKMIKVFNLDHHQIKRYNRCLQECFSAGMGIMKATIVLKPIMHLITATGLSAVFLIGVYQIQSKAMTPGDLTSFVVALVLLLQPIKVVGSVFSKMQRIFAPAERVFEKMDLPAQIQNPENPVAINEFKTLSFRAVSFSYEPENPVLQSISFDVTAGETIALVGPSGSGKSTLVDLIPRFMDVDAGEILMNGQNIKTLALKNLHQHFAIVSQDPVLFSGTIKENLLMGKLNATDDELKTAMAMAHLTDWVNTLEEGWNKQVGDSGGFLSGGQKQRVAIARAFLKDAPILILDEATSALDNESEAMVQEALSRLRVGRTAFVIAHRLSTIQHADRILVMQGGRIVEDGTHASLVDAKGLYHKLYQLQFREA